MIFPTTPHLPCVISCLQGSLSQQLAFDKTDDLQPKNDVTHRLYLAIDLTSYPTCTSILQFFSKSTSSFHCYFQCLLLPSLDNGLIPNKLATHLCTTLFKPFISTSNTVCHSAITQLPQPYLIGWHYHCIITIISFAWTLFVSQQFFTASTVVIEWLFLSLHYFNLT